MLISNLLIKLNLKWQLIIPDGRRSVRGRLDCHTCVSGVVVGPATSAFSVHHPELNIVQPLRSFINFMNIDELYV